MAMEQGFTEWLQRNRLTVVEVERDAGRIRVREHGDACTELSCPSETLILSDDEDSTSDLGSLNPGDIIKVEKTAGGPQRIVVLRRVWEEYTSPEV